MPLCVVALQPAPKAAGVITVNTTTDDSASGDGLCSLRKAINNANAEADTTRGDCAAGSGDDTINFTVSGTITLGSSLPAIQNNLTIDGSGQTVTIDGASSYGVFVVNGTLDLENLTIAYGNAQYGGGVESDGTLTVNDVTFSGNSAQWGGAIYNGIFGALTVSGSTFSGNQAQEGGGGAIYNAGSFSSGGPNITNSTFSGNSAQYGGAVFSDVFSFLTVTNATLSGNRARNGGNIYSNTGGPHGGSLTVANSILADGGSGGDCYGTVTDGGYNIADDDTCGFAGTGANGDTIGDGVDPLLDTNGLQNNGGPTETIALQSTSRAIEAIPTTPTDLCPPTDQRGAPRPAIGNACDIGAFEFGGVVPTVEVSVTPLSINFGKVQPKTTVKQTVTIKNTGTEVLNLTVTNDLKPPFGETGAGSFSLAKGKSHKVVVTFTPLAAGAAKPQTLTVDSDATNHKHLGVRVSGSGK